MLTAKQKRKTGAPESTALAPQQRTVAAQSAAR